MTSAARRDDQRQTARTPLRLTATLKSGDRECVGEILDLSKDGAKVRVKEAWDVGTAVNLDIDFFGSCPGAVVWSDEEAVGVQFEEECLLVTLMIGGWCPF